MGLCDVVVDGMIRLSGYMLSFVVRATAYQDGRLDL